MILEVLNIVSVVMSCTVMYSFLVKYTFFILGKNICSGNIHLIV